MAFHRAATLARLGWTEEARGELEMTRALPYEFDMTNFFSAFRDPRETSELWNSLESAGFNTEVVSVARTQ